jgi:excisionase family DNA binding protein
MPGNGDAGGVGQARNHLLSVAEVASMTGLSDTAVYRAIAAGELLAAKLRGRLRIRLADIDAWIESNAVRPVQTDQGTTPSRAAGGRFAAAPVAVPGKGRGLRELMHTQA